MQVLKYVWLIVNGNVLMYNIKRRTVANEAASGGRISVNGKVVKASYEVKIGDIVEIKFGDKISKFEILKIPQRQSEPIETLIKIK